MDSAGVPPRARAIALGNLAIVHREIGQNDLAEQEYHKAIEILAELGLTSEVGRNWGNLANLYRTQVLLRMPIFIARRRKIGVNLQRVFQKDQSSWEMIFLSKLRLVSNPSFTLVQSIRGHQAFYA